jgi:ABC-2 type transport system permease protein
MSAVAATLPRRSVLTSFTGTGQLVRFMLRRDRVRLTVWVASLLALYAYFVTALGALYTTSEERQTRAELMTTPASVFMGGPAYGIDDYTIGAMFANEMSLWMIALLGIMNMFEVVRNTRAEEESGRAELVRAGAVGRHAAVAASLITVVITNVIFAVLGSLLLIAGGDLSVVDTFAMSTAIGLSGLVFAAVALVTSQLTTHGRGATGLALAVLGYSVLIRGIGDLQGDVAVDHGSWISWLSPIAWTQQMRTFVDLRWWPMALSLVAVVALLALGAALASKRDFDGALLAGRNGKADAGGLLSSPLGMAWRQQRTALMWWFIGTFAMFYASGTYLGEGIEEMVADMTESNPAAAEMFGDEPLTAFLAIMILYAALAAAGYAIATTSRAKSEETDGRLALTLAKPVSRARWFAAHLLVVGFGAAVLTMISGALALWAGALVNGDVELATFVKGGAAFLPGVAVLLALTAALYAWLPKATPLMWAIFAFVCITGLFGPLFELPDAVLAISPFWWVGRYPQEAIEASHMIGLSAVALALLLAAFAGFRRRDVVGG